MKRNPKGEQIDFVGAKKDTKKNAGAGFHARPKKKSNAKKSSNRINLDNEIIIGLKPKKERKTSERKKKANNKNAEARRGAQVRNTREKDLLRPDINGTKPKKTKASAKPRGPGIKIIKWTSIIIVVTTCIVLFMLSPIFNIRAINVVGNSKVTASEIIDASDIKTNANMFKMNAKKAERNIEKNPYIANAAIHRQIDGTVDINVEERTPSYIIAIDNKYIYIDSQGYVLEISEEPLNVPTITGYKTDVQNEEAGDRLDTADLMKLDTCIKIMNSAASNNIADLITGIDISNANAYTLSLGTKGITVHFGDGTKINDKMLWIITIMNDENGASGEMFLDSTRPYFRGV